GVARGPARRLQHLVAGQENSAGRGHEVVGCELPLTQMHRQRRLASLACFPHRVAAGGDSDFKRLVRSGGYRDSSLWPFEHDDFLEAGIRSDAREIVAPEYHGGRIIS